MKASELMAALRKLMRQHGDQEVLCDCGSIHASLSSVDVGYELEGAGPSFVIYQRGEEDSHLCRPEGFRSGRFRFS